MEADFWFTRSCLGNQLPPMEWTFSQAQGTVKLEGIQHTDDNHGGGGGRNYCIG
jgi:hypothetical protein